MCAGPWVRGLVSRRRDLRPPGRRQQGRVRGLRRHPGREGADAPRLAKHRGEAREDARGAPPPGASAETRPGLPPEAAKLLAELRQKVESECDYVGERFSEEARRIHYGEAEKRGIYGEASDEQ